VTFVVNVAQKRYERETDHDVMSRENRTKQNDQHEKGHFSASSQPNGAIPFTEHTQEGNEDNHHV